MLPAFLGLNFESIPVLRKRTDQMISQSPFWTEFFNDSVIVEWCEETQLRVSKLSGYTSIFFLPFSC